MEFLLKRVIRDLASAVAIAWLKRKHGLFLGAGVRMAGLPIIDIRNGASVHVGDRVVLNSLNYGYHANMFGRTKLFADRLGATIRIGAGSRLHGTCVHAFESITIGERCLIAANCQIIDGNGHETSFPNVERRLHTSDKARPVIIGDDVWLGLGVLVLPGVTIGQGAVVGAGSIVARDIPPFAVAVGNPARVVRRYTSGKSSETSDP